MSSDFYWTNMHKDVIKYITKCDYCQKYKNYGNRSAPYKVTTIPATCFEEVSLDAVGPLPTSADGNRYALCIQDRLSMLSKKKIQDTTFRCCLKLSKCTSGCKVAVLHFLLN
jgi:hypothetical protein